MLHNLQVNKNTIGILQVALANFFIGFNIISNKYLVHKIPVSVLLELRYFFGTMILCIMCVVLNKRHLHATPFQFYLTEKRYTHREKFIYILMALSGGSIFNVIYMLGMRHTSAISTGIITSSIPILIVLLSYIFFKHKIGKNHIISAILVSLSICILTLGNQSKSVQGSLDHTQIANFIVFLAMIPEAMFTIFAKMLTLKVSPIVSACLINLINLIVCTPFFVFTISTQFHLQILSIFDVFLSFLIGLFCGALFYSFYNSGIAKISAQTAGLLTGVIPISTTLLSLVFLGEAFGLLSFVGMIFVLTSIYVGVRSTSKKAIQ